MKKCVVIGGGVAGLTAAAYLAKNKFKVTLIESSPKLGGRAYSFSDQNTNSTIDNGQHILMGCYTDTLRFLKLIGAQTNFIYQQRLEVNFLKPGNKLVRLKSFPAFYPLNLVLALLNFKALSISERFSVLFFMIKPPFVSHQKLVNKNVKEWLEENHQSKNVISSLWEMIAVGALNTNIKKASALIFHELLMKMFFKGNFSSTIILPKYSLTESYVTNAKNFIEENYGEIKLSSSVDEIIIAYDKVIGIKINGEAFNDFDFLISAIPFYSIQKIIPRNILDDNISFEYSSILNIHIWLKNNPLPESFYGLIDSPVHWIFNKNDHLNIVISDADYLMSKSSEEIIEMCKTELKKFAGINKSEIIEYKVLKEKRATFIPTNNIIYSRPGSKTKIKNLFLAGDWTDTGLPSTIESAAKSGRIASELIVESRT